MPAAGSSTTSVNSNASGGTYIVQIFSRFAPPELSPLLVRLDPDTTVAQCIQAALNQYLERVPLMVLPSDAVAEYTLSHATADGHPVIPPMPVFDSHVILRHVPSLEFPYMLVLSYTPLREDSDTSDDPHSGTRDSTSGAMTAQQQQQRAAALRYPSRQKTLSLAEKQAREQELQELQERREANVRLIERKRMDKEREAFQHSETYEVLRQETQKKEDEIEEQRQIAAEVAAEEARLKEAAIARAAEEASREEDPVVRSHKALAQHRADMLSSVEAERQRLAEVARRREERAEQARVEAERVKQERRLQWKREQNERMKHSMDRLLADLDSRIATDSAQTEQRFEEERFMRKDVERIQQELRGIAQLEALRHVPKIAERNVRVAAIAAREAYADEKSKLAIERSELDTVAQGERQIQWALEEERRKEALVSKLELQYRSTMFAGPTDRSTGNISAL